MLGAGVGLEIGDGGVAGATAGAVGVGTFTIGAEAEDGGGVGLETGDGGVGGAIAGATAGDGLGVGVGDGDGLGDGGFDAGSKAGGFVGGCTGDIGDTFVVQVALIVCSPAPLALTTTVFSPAVLYVDFTDSPVPEASPLHA